MTNYVVAALYKFVDFKRFKNFRVPLLRECNRNGIKGTLLIAHEGINGTIAGTREGIDNVLAFLRAQPEFNDLEHKESPANKMPFLRMKVRLKKEIVTIGIPNVSPTKKVGTYVTPEEWNNLINRNDVLLIDTRNTYEVEVGTFKGAVNPNTESFREFPEYVKKHYDPQKHKHVAMFCTGGIRCEKASSYMLEEGFENVYHLKGGILKYLEEVPQEKSTWEGDCFVFDGRVAVTHGLKQSDYDQCHGCRYPIKEEDKEHPHYKAGVHCHRCYNKRSQEQHARAAERQRQIELAKKRNQQHMGVPQ